MITLCLLPIVSKPLPKWVVCLDMLDLQVLCHVRSEWEFNATLNVL